LATELAASGCSTTLVDVYVECGRWPVTRFPAIYAELARNHPRLWWVVYRAAVRQLNPNWVIGQFLRRGLHQLMQRERPDVVVSVLPAVNGLLAEAVGPYDARLEVVLTDWHSVHPYWVARGVDHYTAPTDSAAEDCVRYGAHGNAVDVVGIPVRREFARAAAPKDPAQRLTILAMMGAEGSPRALRNLAAVANSSIAAHLVVVCGRSHDLRVQVERLHARLPMQVLGFVEDVAGLMRSADILVTKAGGLTLAEAFACGIAVVIHDVLPGQESGNLEYVLAHRAVAYASTPRRLVRTLTELARDASRRALLAECGARLARPEAAQQIAAKILERLDASRA
jgi:UDP-N-acetylglucosamine:LPS N-acetylglucosamine transferase